MVLPRLHVVVGDDVVGAHDFRAQLLPVLEAGGPSPALHLRARRTPARQLHRVAGWLVGWLARADAARRAHVIVNDRVDVALAVGASGVHLREDSLPLAEARSLWQARRPHRTSALGDGLVGRSIHSPAQVASFPAGSVDYLVLGAVYPTASHPGRSPLGLAAVAAAKSVARGAGARDAGAAIVAIGGITPERVGPVCAAGAWGVAVSSGVWNDREPAKAVARYMAAFPPAPPRPTPRDLESDRR